MCFPDVFQTGWFTLCASVCVIVSDTLQSWLRASKKEFEMPTQRPEWRLASKTDIPKNTLCGGKMVVNSSPPSFSFMNPPDSSLLLHPPPFINQLLSSLVHFSFYLHLCLCFRLFFCLFQGLLGSEEPFSSRSWSSLQLLRAFIPKDPPVLPEELWQRGLASPEWPLLIFISREPQVMNALHRPSIDNFSPACLL